MKRKRVLPLIAYMLLASAGLRLGEGAGMALAWAEDAPPQEELQCPQLQESEEVLAAFSARDEALSERELALADREIALQSAQEELSVRLEELKAAEEQLSETVERVDGAVERDVDRMTAIYAAMKPRDAADLFSEMAPEFSAGFLIRMQPEAAAAILAGLDPQTAYSISVTMAGRNSGAPSE